MVAEGLKDLFHSEGVGLISLTEGSKIFVEKLSTKSPVHQIVISPFAEDANFLDTIQSWPGPEVCTGFAPATWVLSPVAGCQG